jgi:hypothetical protein
MWPYRPEELAFKDSCYCRCGAPFGSITIGRLTLTACTAVLTGTAEENADCHYREHPVSQLADDIGPELQAMPSARSYLFRMPATRPDGSL